MTLIGRSLKSCERQGVRMKVRCPFKSPCEWYSLALEEMGQRERPGDEHNPRILQYHMSTSIKSTEDEVSWCSAFVNWCIINSGKKGTNSAVARSWLKWGKQLDKPKIGAITVLWRKSRYSWQGHVGFFVSQSDTHISLLGGNQHDRVCISSYEKQRLLGYRWPV